jgi:competence ComEA-like helix-hairpin-helix protein
MSKQFISGYFSFTKKERTGTFALLILIAVLIIAPFLFPFFIKKKTFSPDAFKKEIASLKIKQADSSLKYQPKNYDDEQPAYLQQTEKRYNREQSIKGELFYFNPNTLDEAGWQRLGLKDKTIATIKNYLSKGGKFYKPEDIKKIWGLNEALAESLIPYVQIEKPTGQKNDVANNYPKPVYEKPVYKPSVVDINIADTTAFIALPGIGSKLAQRIIGFRDKLGGFYKIEQVGETFGLQDSTFQKIKARLILSNNDVKQLNINTATLDELKIHPYLRYAIANAIVQYRTQHGNFSSINDLKKIVLITEDIFSKAAPYLKIN